MDQPSVGVEEMRREYVTSGIAESDIDADPMLTFATWFRTAVAASIDEPNAMVVATAGADGTPSSRTVLLKGYDSRGFVFYTNHGSRKGSELATNPRCALLFPWYALQRQVRVEGLAEKVSAEETAVYFASRPRPSQLGAWASHQSSVVADRSVLDTAYAEVEQRFDGAPVPTPPFWGGYVVRPLVIEFWQGRQGRMHDRLVCRRTDVDSSDWELTRLAP